MKLRWSPSLCLFLCLGVSLQAQEPPEESEELISSLPNRLSAKTVASFNFVSLQGESSKRVHRLISQWTNNQDLNASVWTGEMICFMGEALLVHEGTQKQALLELQESDYLYQCRINMESSTKLLDGGAAKSFVDLLQEVEGSYRGSVVVDSSDDQHKLQSKAYSALALGCYKNASDRFHCRVYNKIPVIPVD